ncbi:MAG TPA: MaoC family dehydratase [Steroidobacteraceae bacterium]|nr:MaoC family dehydratase [Steroidobacteraceae bacterium]
MSTGLYFEDLHIGQRFRSGTYLVTAELIRAFASEFDPQPFHLDEAAAKGTLFGGLVASGWHTAAITMRLVLESNMKMAGGTLGLGAEVRWSTPVRPGDLLHVEGEVIEAAASNSRPDRGKVATRCETKNERGEVVQLLIARLLVPRRAKTTAG